MPALASKRKCCLTAAAARATKYGAHAKRSRWHVGPGAAEPAEAPDISEKRSAVHQFGIVGGEYDSKEERLQQILDRLPADAGTTLILAGPASAATVGATIDRCRRKAVAAAAREKAGRSKAVASMCQGVELSEEFLEQWTCGRCTMINGGLADGCYACETRRGAFPRITVVTVDPQSASRAAPWNAASCQLVINYDLPRSVSDYIRRLSALHPLEAKAPAPPERVAYTFVEESELKSRALREVAALLRSTRQYVDAAKAAEFDSALQLVEDNGAGEEEEGWDDGDADEDSEACDCAHCRGSILGSMSYHPLLPVPGIQVSANSGVEVVRLPLRALEDFDKAVPFIAPRLRGHVCTLICLHCLNVHTPWDGWEQYFAPPECTGTVRVVLVLADGVSWHEYPDSALVGAGGSAWIDILDMDSMDRSDMLLERLVDHEAALLNGQSERIVLMGMSQGGGQSMLRFLRSNLRLGGWVGSVCHVPTAPHTPRNRDPLIVGGRPTVNRNQPVRLLAGESDCVFPPGLVLRDAARLRNVGGFTNVEVELRPGLAHEGPLEAPQPPKPDSSAATGARARSPARGAPTATGASTVSAAPVLSRGASKSFREAEAEAALQRSKAINRAEKRVPELLFVQRFLPSMVDFGPTSGTEAC
ncbi:unnamed protein product [Polarella glacialis]|uniref:RanBP2-type domain-containing protein n=1 Tax=Polarella glacialis TaxID=89957 RepID=A0A813IQ03_POLGL|nr:unnamed protein product [Polarella glacialis]